MENIILQNTFGNYEHFCHHLVHEVFKSHDLIDELENIEEIDVESDFSRRIFLNTKNHGYTIRMWNVHDDDNIVEVEYTLFQKSGDDVVEIL